MKIRILLVEDDLSLREVLKQSLELEGFSVDSHSTLAGGRAALAYHLSTLRNPDTFSIAIVDLGLPDGDGSTLIRLIRSQSKIPVLVISAREDDVSKINLLDAGADDYLVKPFSIGELKARIRVALRRQSPEVNVSSDEIRIGTLEINLPKRKVKRSGERVHLTRTEFNLLARLLSQAGQVVTHRQLLNDVWGAEYVEHVHYLRLYMTQLRAKLEADPAAPELLLTETGVGYRFCELS
ncbi:MAG: winged helix-turn-helix domain-containing protein [Burkholderiales bacterium]|nr:winged helix-turn-helix domain-containing protein [Burkholderiales bacterium]